MSKKSKIQLAKEFRKSPTKSEKIMWNAIRNRQFLDLKFRRQYLINGYLVDFYCYELKLAIEIDGSVHLDEIQINKDIERQKIIEDHGIRFFRVKSEDVEYNIQEVLNRLKIFINNNFEIKDEH
ncbi:endonuclease domain-containing protein [Patescibacteria group bacterium]|nr:endonuclease domain-containing protein [Patescibacteria group bacterium]MBU4601322.1 endonuclease domain-containing protein [Patescibacteria group bacterium]MCG2698631.1 endonuclease domain-containing protein [Candidatus Parcubacteria bacterium]